MRESMMSCLEIRDTIIEVEKGNAILNGEGEGIKKLSGWDLR
jgi:hypothetical protein